MTAVATPGSFVHDLRHRFSLELRPDDELDARLRAVAADLEAAGLLLPGATSAPRFHPHLTLLRAADIGAATAQLVATALSTDGDGSVCLDEASTFGGGRIVHVTPTDRVVLERARAVAVAAIAADQLDPLVHEREWTPHVTLAYAVPNPARADALAHVSGVLPIKGRWDSVQVWDLDVRPTQLVRRVFVPFPG